MRGINRAILVVILAAATAGLAIVHTSSAQTPADPAREVFEVASVKQNLDDVPEGISLQPTGGVRFTGFRLRTLIVLTYGSPIGGPSWIATDRFDIVAKAAGDISADARGRRSERLTAMLKTLLEDRFKLRVHSEMREMPAFALRLSRRDGQLGPRMHESTIQCPRFVTGQPLPKVDPDNWCGIRVVGGVITGQGVSASQIAGNLGGYPAVDRFVFDRTGLTGRYDFQIEYSPAFADAADPAANAGPSLFTALKEQLGLTLEPEKAALPVIVIDRVEHPTPD